MQSLDGKVVVVTGAAGNLGHAVCNAFAAAGARVALVDLRQDALEALRSALPAG